MQHSDENTLSGAPNLETPHLIRVTTWITPPQDTLDGWTVIKPFLFLRLVLADGTEGWGEAFTLPCREEGCAQIIHALGARVAAENATAPSDFRTLVAQIADKHRGLDFAAASSALEMALWDIQGKLAKKPLRHLLSDAPTNSVPVYVNIWSRAEPDIGALCDRAKLMVRQGYRAIKFYPLQNRTPVQAAACMAHMRNAVGQDVALLLDLASPDDPALARELAPLVKPHNPYWFEEPVDGEDTRILANIRKTCGMRVVTGEKQCGLPHFRETLAANAADILNPDIAGVGGILDMLEIAALADLQGVSMSPHCWNSMSIAAAAMLQVCAALPNAEMAEIYPDYLPHVAGFSDAGYSLIDGSATLSDRPGLGVQVDADALNTIAAETKEQLLL
jgi:galactonate dehydratase